jgi:hypothetical protein
MIVVISRFDEVILESFPIGKEGLSPGLLNWVFVIRLPGSWVKDNGQKRFRLIFKIRLTWLIGLSCKRQGQRV